MSIPLHEQCWVCGGQAREASIWCEAHNQEPEQQYQERLERILGGKR